MNSDDDTLEARLANIDRAIRRAALREKISELGGIMGGAIGASEEASDMEISFLERVIAWEEGPFSTHAAWLERHGLVFPPPESLKGRRLKEELWRLIEALAKIARVFLYNTNHLSDAELYAEIWREVLEGEGPDFARTPDDACHHDFADYSTGCAGDERVWLTFYATEEERRQYVLDWPETVLPPHKRPSYRRDDRLPVRD